MKRVSRFLLLVVFILTLTAFLSACGGGGGGGGSTPPSTSVTSIATTTAGAQSAAASVSTAQNMVTSNVQLSGLVADGTGVAAPKLKTAPWMNTKKSTIGTFVSRVSPVVKKARMLATSMAGYPVTYDCISGMTVTGGSASTPDSMTIDLDATGSNYTITYNLCKESSTITNGVMTMAVDASGVIYFNMGSAGAPMTVTDYSDTTYTTAIDKSQTAVAMSLTETGTTTITDSMTVNGSFENWDYVAHTHDKEVMSNFSMSDTTSTATIGTLAYDVDTVTLDGSSTGTTYVDDISATVSYSETDSFSSFTLAYKTPTVYGTGTNYDYFSINGTFSISTTPADQCIDGTFSVATNTDVKIDDSTGLTAGGQLTVNGNVVVVFDANGGASVAVNGGTPVSYTSTELDGLCAL